MKKIFLLLVISCLWFGFANGQEIDTNYAGVKVGHQPVKELYNKYDIIVNDDTIKAETGRILLVYNMNEGDWIRKLIVAPDTTGIFRTSIDSIDVSSFVNWFNISCYTQDSSIYISFSREIDLAGLIPVPAGSYSSLKLDADMAGYGYVYIWSQTSRKSIIITGR